MNLNNKLTNNFYYKEFFSGDIKLGKNSIEPPMKYFDYIATLASELQNVRDELNKDRLRFNRKIDEIKIVITSGYRTNDWNKHIKGSRNSLHMKGRAVDSRAMGIPLFIYWSYLLEYSKLRHLGYYRWANFIHAGLINDFTIFKY